MSIELTKAGDEPLHVPLPSGGIGVAERAERDNGTGITVCGVRLNVMSLKGDSGEHEIGFRRRAVRASIAVFRSVPDFPHALPHRTFLAARLLGAVLHSIDKAPRTQALSARCV